MTVAPPESRLGIDRPPINAALPVARLNDPEFTDLIVQWVEWGPKLLVKDHDSVHTEMEVSPGPMFIRTPPGAYALIPLHIDADDYEIEDNEIITDDWLDVEAERETLRAEVLEKSQRFWSFDGPLPVPAGRFVCGCGNETWVARFWSFFDYGKIHDPNRHKFRYRCDVSCKCDVCGQVVTWGVVVPEDHWERWDIRAGRIDASTGKRMLEVAKERVGNGFDS